MKEKENYKQQKKLSFIQFMLELPNFIIVTVSALITGSMIVWMDFIDSLGHFLRTLMVLVLSMRMSKDLRYEYNYGVGKLEDIAVLFCDGLILCGLSVATIVSVIEIMNPSKPSGLLIVIVGWKVITVIVDAIFLWEQYKLRKTDDSMFAKSNFAAWVASILFDSVNLCSVLLAWLMNGHEWTWYFSPIISIVIAVYLGYKCIKRIKKALSELTDKTIPEEEQLQLLKVVASHRGKVKLRFAKSHKVGERTEIDLELSFADETTYKEMLEIKEQLQRDISANIEGSSVNIFI